MDLDEPPRAHDPLALVIRQDLDPLSVADLDARIVALEAEIARCRARRSAAVDHRANADSVFRR